MGLRRAKFNDAHHLCSLFKFKFKYYVFRNMEWLRGRLYGFVEPRIERIELIDEFDPDEQQQQQPQSSRMAGQTDDRSRVGFFQI